MPAGPSSLADLACTGVPKPLIDVAFQYQAALDSGLPDVSTRLLFQDHFLDGGSSIQDHVDDLVWVVRGSKVSSLHSHVSLIRRGSADATALMDEAQREEDVLGGSVAVADVEESPLRNDSIDPSNAMSSPSHPTPPPAEDRSPSGSQSLLRMISDTMTPSKKRRQLSVLWPETLALNLVTQWKFTLTVAVARICQVHGKPQMVAVRREVHRVFGQPTRTNFSSDKDGRGATGDTLDYPNIYFNVENFDQGAFHDIQLSDGYNLAVVLTAGDHTDSNTALFRGVLSYDVIMARVVKKSRENRTVPTEDRKEFIPLLGPERKGKAEIALSISNADLQTNAMMPSSPSTVGGVASPKSVGSPSSVASAEATAGGGGFFSSIIRRGKVALASDKNKTELLRGDEILQCCLTFVSIPIQHICHMLTSSERVNPRQWLYVPETRQELDQLLEASWSSETAMSPTAPRVPQPAGGSGSAGGAPVEEGGGGLFSSLKKRFA